MHKAFPEGHQLSKEENAECIAFRFQEQKRKSDDKTKWYFKPIMTETREDGSDEEYPSVDMITAEGIHYWAVRAEQARHPVLAARYAGLVHEFSFHITGKKAPLTVTQKYVESLLDIIDQCLYKVPVYGITKVARALEISLLLNNKT